MLFPLCGEHNVPFKRSLIRMSNIQSRRLNLAPTNSLPLSGTTPTPIASKPSSPSSLHVVQNLCFALKVTESFNKTNSSPQILPSSSPTDSIPPPPPSPNTFPINLSSASSLNSSLHQPPTLHDDDEEEEEINKDFEPPTNPENDEEEDDDLPISFCVASSSPSNYSDKLTNCTSVRPYLHQVIADNSEVLRSFEESNHINNDENKLGILIHHLFQYSSSDVYYLNRQPEYVL